MKRSTKNNQEYYPECLGQLFVVNAPFMFTSAWAIIKGFLNEKTRAKISIYGSNFHKDLFEICDPDAIPSFLGGNCECPGGCITGHEAGPWEDYEYVYPSKF